jgi:hypothetical protein
LLGLKAKNRSWKTSEDPLAQFGLDAIDLRWTLKDIAAQRSWMINKAHVAKLIQLGLVEMRDDNPPKTNTERVLGAGCILQLVLIATGHEAIYHFDIGSSPAIQTLRKPCRNR